MIAGVGGAVGPRSAPMQLDPSTVVGASGPTLAVGSFLLTVVFGGAVIYGYGGRLNDAVDASMANPLVSVVYGAIAYALVLFVVGYAYSQLTTLGAGSGTFATVAVAAFGVLVLSLAGLGFVVLGVWFTDTVGSRDPWLGLVAVGALAAALWVVLPFAFAALAWFGVAAVGIGGPTRRWIHADATERSAG